MAQPGQSLYASVNTPARLLTDSDLQERDMYLCFQKASPAFETKLSTKQVLTNNPEKSLPKSSAFWSMESQMPQLRLFLNFQLTKSLLSEEAVLLPQKTATKQQQNPNKPTPKKVHFLKEITVLVFFNVSVVHGLGDHFS